jgi:putative lipoic acid-binding regulatory protein
MMFTTQDLQNAHPEQGFTFPGTFELSAMGAADAGLERALPDLLEAAGVAVLRERTAVRASSAGRYVSVRLAFRAESREQYDAAHAALRAHPQVKWTV